MIENILNMLKLHEHLGETENIEIAKGYRGIKDLYKQEKRKNYFKKIENGRKL